MFPSSLPAFQNTEYTEPSRWYLAYGSNLSSATFRGWRGIRPLAAVNVSVPSLELTFDLPAVPYWEPCVANVRMRGDTGEGSRENRVEKYSADPNFDPNFERVLLGVAYLVTPEDYARIIATEGGGNAYKEVYVDCWRIPGNGQGGKSAGEERIIASTLLAPDSKRRLEPMEPSKRYIDIIRAGAREHDMPASYIAYLDSIPFYHTTGIHQKIGAALFLAMWGPLVLLIFLLQTLFADKKTGLVPRWVVILAGLITTSMWKNYDSVWKKIFGSGEVTAGHELKAEELGQKGQLSESEGYLIDV